MLKLADGTLIVGDYVDVIPFSVGQPGLGPDMLETEFQIFPIHWMVLDTEKVATTRRLANPDLSRVNEVGWTDRMPGGGHADAGWTNVGPFEVYGKPVKR